MGTMFDRVGLEIAIDFGAVLDAVDADESLRGIDPVEDEVSFQRGALVVVGIGEPAARF